MRLSARNKLAGKVTKIVPGTVNSIVEIELSASPTISAVVTNDAITDLELTEGSDAVAIVKASNVMIGVCQEGSNSCGCQK